MKKQSRMFQQLLLAVVLSLGALVVGSLSIMFVTSIYQPFAGGARSTSLDFTADGKPYLQRYDAESQSYVFTDLDGHPIEDDATLRPYGSGHSVGLSYEDRYGFSAGREEHLPLPWEQRVQTFQVDERGMPVVFWYLMQAPRAGEGAYFVGYSVKNRRCIGYIGTAGFRPDPVPREQWFDVFDYAVWYSKDTSKETNDSSDEDEGPNPYLVVLNCGSQVLGVSLESRRVRTLLSDQAPPIRSVGTVMWKNRNYLAALTEEAVSFLKPNGETQRFSLPEELRRHALTVARRAEGGLSVARYHQRVFGSPTVRVSVYELAADGTAGKPRDIQLETYEGSGEEMLLPFGSPLLQLAPLVLDFDSWKRYEGLESWGQYVKLSLWSDRWLIAVATLVGAVLAALCYRRQARYCLPLAQRIVWPIYVFLFGIPGWIGYRYGRHWPPMETCEACRAASPRAGEVCAVCDQEFPLPAAKGTEIFA